MNTEEAMRVSKIAYEQGFKVLGYEKPQGRSARWIDGLLAKIGLYRESEIVYLTQLVDQVLEAQLANNKALRHDSETINVLLGRLMALEAKMSCLKPSSFRTLS